MSAVSPSVVHPLVAAFPWLLPALVLLLDAAFPEPPTPLALSGAAALLLGLGVAGWRLADGALPGASTLTRATAAGTFATCGAVVPALALGSLGLMRPRPYLVLVALIVAGVCLAVPPAKRTIGGSTPGRGSPFWLRIARGTAFSLAGIAALAALHGERHQPPEKLDDPSYHLTTVALWRHVHDLRTPKFGYGDPSTAYYPLGGELIAWALLAPLRDSDFLARWGQLPYFVLTLVAASAVARELDLGRSAPPTVALLVLTVPRAFPDLALSAGNDHSTAFFAVAAVVAGLRLAACPSNGSALFAGTAVGLLVGSKYLGLLFALPIVVLLFVAVAAPDRPLSARAAGRLLFLAGLAAALAGGYTYLRNALVLGNPVFPSPIGLLGFELPGWQEASLAVRRQRPEFAIEPLSFLFDRRLLGSAFPWLAVPAALAAPVLAWTTAGRLGPRLRRALVVLLPAVFFLEFLLIVHDHRDVRYLFAAIALAAVAVNAVVAWALPGRRRAAELVAALLVVARFAFGNEPLPPNALLAAAPIVAIAAAVLLDTLGPRTRSLAASSAVAALAAATALTPSVHAYQRERVRRDPLVAALAREAPQGTVVAYAGFNRPYPLHGARLEHRVEQVPTRGPVEARHFSWDGDASLPWRTGRYRIWYRNLRQLNVEYVVTVAAAEPERRWIDRNPLHFEPVATSGTASLWRFTPEGRDLPPR